MRKMIHVAFLVCLVLSQQSLAFEAKSGLPNFFVAGVRTEVHRVVVASKCTAYAVVNCSGLVVDGKLDLGKLDTSQFEGDLSQLAQAGSARLRLVLRYTLSQAQGVNAENKKVIKETLEGICRAAGFGSIRTSEMSTSVEWADTFSSVRRLQDADKTDETIIEDELTKAYPLRTRLSKLVLGNADCIVEIKQTFDGRQRDLSAELKKSVQHAIHAMGLGKNKGMIQFRVSSTTAGEAVVERLFDSTPPVRIPPDAGPAIREFLAQRLAEYKPSAARTLAIGLGFENFTYSHAPNGGAPEKLLGNRAPSFTLERIDGEMLELTSFLKDRPGLITFWGVACGPCRLEAPHLTTMYKKHAGQFAILAVNAYDESRKVVSRYVNQTQLTHPIVLGGGNVARELYHVGAYPTTFWVDRQGIVQDYEIGFDSADLLERRIARMIVVD